MSSDEYRQQESELDELYREIISAIRALEKPTSVAFLGPRDTFSHMAALRVFGASTDYHPLPSFDDVFTEVERGRIDYGVVPVESSMGGSVSGTLVFDLQEKSIGDYFKPLFNRDQVKRPFYLGADQVFTNRGDPNSEAISKVIGDAMQEVVERRR